MQIPIHKVQSVMWESTWIRRLFSMDTVHIRQATAGGAVSSDDSEAWKEQCDAHGHPSVNATRTRQLRPSVPLVAPAQARRCVRKSTRSGFAGSAAFALTPFAVGWWLGGLGHSLGAVLGRVAGSLARCTEAGPPRMGAI